MRVGGPSARAADRILQAPGFPGESGHDARSSEGIQGLHRLGKCFHHREELREDRVELREDGLQIGGPGCRKEDVRLLAYRGDGYMIGKRGFSAESGAKDISMSRLACREGEAGRGGDSQVRYSGR